MAVPAKTSILYRIGTDLEKEVPATGLIQSGSTIVLNSEAIPVSYKAGNVNVTALSIGCGVTNIGAAAFDLCINLAGNLVIPDSVISVASRAFKDCANITGLTMSQSVIEIGSRAFEDCVGITGSLVIPNTTTVIRSDAFKNCTGFTGSLTLGSSLTTIEEEAFYNCGFSGNLVIPNSVTTVGTYAFANCVNITGVTISQSMTTIPNGMFAGCLAINGNIVIPNSITSIGSYAFQGILAGINNLTIGQSVVSIGEEAFQYTPINSISFPNSLQTIGVRAFSNCLINSPISFGTTLNGSALTTISDEAFLDSAFTGSIVIPNNVTTIGNSAFSGNTYANGIIRIGTGVSSIGNHAFAFTSGITRVESWAGSAPTAGITPFDSCGTNEIHVKFLATGYGSVYAGMNVIYDVDVLDPKIFITQLGLKKGYSFANGSVTAYFREYDPIPTSLELGNGITSIQIGAFSGCSSLTSLTLNNQIVEIGTEAFYNTPLTGILVIPASVQALRSSCFANTSFSEIHFLGSNPPSIIEFDVFLGTGYPDMHVPVGTASLYAAAFPDFLTIIDDL